jgi:hypothetical protein
LIWVVDGEPCAGSRAPAGLITLLRSLSPRSSGERATASGAVSAGSNPAGSTTQRHKFEHSGNLGRTEARAPDLRRCGRAPELVPDTCPESAADEQVSPAQADWRSRSPGRSVTSGRCTCAYAAVMRRWRTRSAACRNGSGSGRQVEVAHPRSSPPLATGELDMVICRASPPAHVTADRCGGGRHSSRQRCSAYRALWGLDGEGDHAHPDGVRLALLRCQAPSPRATGLSTWRVSLPLPLPNSTSVPSPPMLR